MAGMLFLAFSLCTLSFCQSTPHDLDQVLLGVYDPINGALNYDTTAAARLWQVSADLADLTATAR